MLAPFVTLSALVWSAATTDITMLAVLCWLLVGGAVLVLIAAATN